MQEIKKILQPQIVETVLFDTTQVLSQPEIQEIPGEITDIMDIPGDAHTILQTLAKMV
jgi:hypothetical protein